jgi:hypothetical protein
MTLPFATNIDIRDTVRYKNVIKEYGFGPNVWHPHLAERWGFLHWDQDRTPSSRPYTAPYREYYVGSEWQCYHRMVKVKNTYMFRNKDFFFYISMVSTRAWINTSLKCQNNSFIIQNKYQVYTIFYFKKLDISHSLIIYFTSFKA